MANIITSRSKSRRFKPHYNNATGVYYHTSRDYVRDLKSKGLEPANPSAIKQRLSGGKPYSPSDWARKMTKVGCDQVKENGKTSGVFNTEMAKHLKMEVPERIARQTSGGTYTE